MVLGRFGLVISLLTTVVLPNGFVGVAFAQSASPDAGAPQETFVPAAPNVLAGNEIVIMIQRVPATVSLGTAGQLQASATGGIRELSQLAPGLTITQQGAIVQPNIRGVGTTLAGTGADPAVAHYVDGDDPWLAGNRSWQKKSVVLNANLEWRSGDEHFKVMLFGESPTNQRSMLYVREAVGGDFVFYPKWWSWGSALDFDTRHHAAPACAAQCRLEA